MRAPGTILASVGRRLRGAGGRLAGLWGSLSIYARRRLFAVAALIAIVVLFFAVAVPNFPCSFPGGDYCAPDDDAQQLVPADSLAYLHANLDPDTREYADAAELADRIPLFSGQLIERALGALPASAAGSAEFDRQIRPWLGGEAALAVLPDAAPAPQTVELLEIDDSEGAAAYAREIASGTPRTSDYRGIEVSEGSRGTASAEVEGFLVLGSAGAVRSVIDVAMATDGATSLADDDAVQGLRDQLPEHRVADAYLSADGAEQLIAGAGGTLSALTPLLDPGATDGAAAGLEASGDGVELTLRSALDSERASGSPGFFAAFPPFEPTLPQRLDAEALAYLGIGAPRTAVGALLAQASSSAPGIAAGFEDLFKTLADEDQVDVERQLLDSLGDEAAFALSPRSGAAAAGPPFAQFVAAGVDEDEARRAFAALQQPLVKALGTSEGTKNPGFSAADVGGVQAQSLQVSPALDLTYAIFDGLAAVASDPAGIEQLASGDGGLDEADQFERATEGFDDRLSVLLYLDLESLVSTGEQLGLAEDPVYATFAGDFRRLQALGLSVSSGDDMLSTDARLLIAEAEAGDGEAQTTGSASD